MKNILSFDTVTLYRCYDCGCMFTIDDYNKDIKMMILNCKETYYTECPNCNSMCTDGFILNKLGGKKRFINIKLNGKDKQITVIE